MFISFFSGKVMLFYGITLIMKEKSNASALGAEVDTDGAKFADKLGICIFTRHPGGGRYESGLRCIKPVGPVLQANPD